MRLHEFLSDRREALVAASTQIILRDMPERRADEVDAHLHGFIDGVVRALRRLDGVASDLGDAEACASDVARDRRRRGFPVQNLVWTYSALSVALGKVGGEEHLAFDVEEYSAFNQEIDRHVADAIEAFTEDARRELDQRLGERLGSLAHELRNALASASMAFTMLERGLVGINGRTGDVVRRSHKRMDTLIEQTLAAARTRFGAARAGLHRMSLAPLLLEIESSTVLERGIALIIEVDHSLTVVGDEHLLTTALSNLVQNAVKFSRDGASVVLRARGDESATLIEVEDGCGGIPDGKSEGLFKPFVQGRPDGRGVGLGLTIALEAVRTLGGELGVRDVPTKGCVFTVRLPRADFPRAFPAGSTAS